MQLDGMILVLGGMARLLPSQGLQMREPPHTDGGLWSHPPATTEWIPGDLVLVSFDLSGLKTVAPGRAFYGVGMTLTGRMERFWSNKPPSQRGVPSTGRWANTRLTPLASYLLICLPVLTR